MKLGNLVKPKDSLGEILLVNDKDFFSPPSDLTRYVKWPSNQTAVVVSIKKIKDQDWCRVILQSIVGWTMVELCDVVEESWWDVENHYEKKKMLYRS